MLGKNDNPTVAATPTAHHAVGAGHGGLPTKTGTVTAQASPAAQVACGGKRPAAADTPKPQFDHAPAPKDVLKKDTVYTAVMRTSCGTIAIQLDTTTAPQTVGELRVPRGQGLSSTASSSTAWSTRST